MEVDRALAAVHCLHVVLSRIAPMKVMSPSLTSAFRVSVDCRVCLDCLSCVRVRHCLLGVAFSFFFNAAATPPSPYLLGRASASTSLPALHHRNAPAPVLPAAPRVSPLSSLRRRGTPRCRCYRSRRRPPRFPPPSHAGAPRVARRASVLDHGPAERCSSCCRAPAAAKSGAPPRSRARPGRSVVVANHRRQSRCTYVSSLLSRAPVIRLLPGAVAPPVRAPPYAEVLSTSPRATTTVSPAP